LPTGGELRPCHRFAGRKVSRPPASHWLFLLNADGALSRNVSRKHAMEMLLTGD